MTEPATGIQAYKLYRKQVHHALAFDPALRDRVLGIFDDSVNDFLEVHPDAAVEDLCQQYGTPEEFAANVRDNLDEDALQKQLRRYSLARLAVFLVLGLALIFAVWYCVSLAAG